MHSEHLRSSKHTVHLGLHKINVSRDNTNATALSQNGYSIEIIQIEPLIARVLILWVTPVGGQEFVIGISHVLRMFF